MKMTADLTKLNQIPKCHRTHTVKLMDKSKKDSQMPLQDVKILLSSLIRKQQILEKCNENILKLLTEEAAITKDIENLLDFANYINRKMAEETTHR